MNQKKWLLLLALAACVAVASGVGIYAFSGVHPNPRQLKLIGEFDRYFGDRDSKNCHRVVDEILEFAEANNDNELRARGLARLAFADLEFGHWRVDWEAKLKEAESLCDSEHSIAAAEIKMYGGSLRAKFQQSFESAHADLNSAIELLSRMDDDRALALAYFFRAQIQMFLNWKEDSIESGLKSLALAREIGDPDLTYLALSRMCQVYRYSNEIEKASVYAKEIVESRPESRIARDTLFTAGLLPDFEVELQQKINELEANESKTGADWSKLGALYRAWAFVDFGLENYEAALGRFDKAIECLGEAKSEPEVLEMRFSRVNCLVKLGEIPEARTEFDELFQDCQKTGNFGRVRRSASQFSRMFEQFGDFESALEWGRNTEKLWQEKTNASISQAENSIDEFLNRRNSQKEFWRLRESRQREQLAWFSVLACLLGSGCTLAFYTAMRIKEYRASQAELGSLVDMRTESLILAREKAELAAQAQGDFLARVNHEIRNPLQAIVGFSELLRDSGSSFDKDTSDQVMEGIYSSSRDLMELVKDVLDVAKLERGDVVVEVQEFSLRELCSKVEDDVSQLTDADAARVEFSFAEGISDAYMSDPTLLRQILVNLIDNSFEHAAAELVQVRFSNRRSSEFDDLNLVVEVEDSGEGIPEEYHAQIFTPFADTPNDNLGKGLGTYIAKLLVTCLGGEISFKSELGKGTTFTVELPVEVADLDRPAGEPADAAFVPLKILVVDDKQVIRELVCKQLESIGHQPSSSSGLASTLEAIEEECPDVVLLDLRMPDHDGFEVLAEIRRVCGNKVKVVAMTGDATDHVKKRVATSGFDGFLIKPFQPSQLRRTVAVNPKSPK